MKNKIITYFILAIVLSGNYYCSTKENTWAVRQYHMLTTQYNVLFNGQQSLLEGEQLIEDNYIRDYTTILPVFENSDENAGAIALSQMERAIDKAQKAIDLHSITDKPRRKKGEKSERYKEFRRKKEYNNLIDECYLLMAKGQYYKREYENAEKTFKHLLRDYKDNKILYETNVWYARNLIEQEKYILAEKYITEITEDPEFPKKFHNIASAVKIDMNIRQERFSEAIPHLLALTENANGKNEKAKYYYILAQTYSKIGFIDEAIATFRELIDKHPEYEMEFKAHMAIVHLYEGTGNIEMILAELNEMLEDKRNKTYQDQIYYAMADVFVKDGKMEQAVEHYWKSVRSSVDNDNQKAFSFNKLGNYYYSLENYVDAKHCYDSTLMFLSTENFDTDELTTRLQNIGELFSYLNIVVREDSLQKVAILSDEKRDEIISRMVEEAEKNTKAEIAPAIIPKKKASKRRSLKKEPDEPKWYFYNPQSVEVGNREFVRKWGVRTARDNWRRKSKSSISLDFADLGSDVSEETIVSIPKGKSVTKEDLLKTFPLTPESLENSHKKIKNALFNAGIVYDQKLENHVMAMKTFEELMRRYPGDDFDVAAAYQLYLIAKKDGKINNANIYKNKILNDFPESEFAEIIKDPNYLDKKEIAEAHAERLYKNAYKSYQNDEYNKLIEQCESALQRYPKTALKPNFLYLKAMGIGHIQGKDKFEDALQEVLRANPDDELLALTHNVWDKLKKGETPQQFSQVDMDRSRKIRQSRNWEFDKIPEASIKTVEEKTPLRDLKISEKTYKMNEFALHYFVLILPQEKIANVRREFNKFNKKKYKHVQMREENFDVSDKLLLVYNLKNKTEALEYLNKIIFYDEAYGQLEDVNYRNFIITAENFNIFRQKRDVAEYLDFYVNNYFYGGKTLKARKEISSSGQLPIPAKETKTEDGRTKIRLFKKKSNKEKPLREKRVKEKEIESLSIEENPDANIEKFVFEPDTNHYFVIIVPTKSVNVNYLWTAIYNYNKEHRVKKSDFKKGQKMFVAYYIGNADKAMEYFRGIIQNDAVYDELKNADYRNFIISESNFNILVKQKNLNSYIDFFKTNYLNK